MEITRESLPGSKVAFTIRMDVTEVKEAFHRSAEAVRKSARLPGYRKGKAPLPMVRERFRGDVLEEARRRIAQSSLRQALETQPVISPLSDAEMAGIEEIREESIPITLRATIEVLPEVALGAYRGLKLKAPSETVAEADVESMKRGLLEETARHESRDRAAQTGDIVILDYSCREADGNDPPAPGQAIEGAEAQAYAVEIGKKRTVPGFEEALLGMHPGEEKTFPLAFPENVTEKRLAGRDLFVTLKVTEVKEKVLPSFDDDLAKGLGLPDAPALEENLRERVAHVKKARRRQILEDSTLEALLDLHPGFPLPEGLIEEEFARLARRIAGDLASRGTTLEEYMKREAMTPESFRAKFLPRAEDSVRGFLLLLRIAQVESLAAGDEDVMIQIARAAHAAGEDPRAVAARLTRKEIGRLRQEVLCQKALNLLLENAEIEEETDVDAVPEEVA